MLRYDAKQDSVVLSPRQGDVGYDIWLDQEYTLEPGERKLIKTSIRLQMPPARGLRGVLIRALFGAPLTWALIIKDRSGNAARGLTVSGGVVDVESYIGVIGVILTNNNLTPVVVTGKVAQFILIPCFTPGLLETFDLHETERGKAGFGSTGLGVKVIKL